jgi:hypothetical protein
MKVLIIGAGQLGSRYLQGLVHYSQPLEILVLDLSQESLKIAGDRWREAGGEGAKHNIRFIKAINKVPLLIDLAIVTTTADVRVQVIQTLVKNTTVRYWVLEKILTQSVSQLEQLLQLLKGTEGAWVNTARRMSHWHQRIHEMLPGSKNIKVYVGDKLWGLACSSIHFLDLIDWWAGEKLVSINTSKLSSEWFASKRPGFYEVMGRLTASYSGGSEIIMESKNENGMLNIHIEAKDGSWIINEANGIAKGPGGVVIHGRIEHQSELTARLVSSILNTGSCDLPTLVESSYLHRIFIKSMLEHWNKVHNRNDTIIPIT